jgi:hypothetical protein
MPPVEVVGLAFGVWGAGAVGRSLVGVGWESENRIVGESGRCGVMESVSESESERDCRNGGVGLGGSLSCLSRCIVVCGHDLSFGFEICLDGLGQNLPFSFASYARRIPETSRSSLRHL